MLAIVGVSDGPDRGRSRRRPRTVLRRDRRILRPGVGVVVETVQAVASPGSSPQRHLQRVQRQLAGHRRGGAPADDASGEHVGHERGERHPRPDRHVGEVDDPHRLSAVEVKLRLTRSGGLAAVLSAFVVTNRRPRWAPCSPA